MRLTAGTLWGATIIGGFVIAMGFTAYTNLPSGGVAGDGSGLSIWENWPYLILLVPAYLFVRGGWQDRHKYSYGGAIIYYGGGAILVVLAVGIVVLGPDLLGRALGQSQAKTRLWFECQVLSQPGPTVRCAGNEKLVNTIDWGVLLLASFGAMFLFGLWKVKIVQGATAVVATIIILPFLAWLAWGALPADYKSAVGNVNPFVTTEQERRNADTKPARSGGQTRTVYVPVPTTQPIDANSLPRCDHPTYVGVAALRDCRKVTYVAGNVVQLQMQAGDRAYSNKLSELGRATVDGTFATWTPKASGTAYVFAVKENECFKPHLSPKELCG